MRGNKGGRDSSADRNALPSPHERIFHASAPASAGEGGSAPFSSEELLAHLDAAVNLAAYLVGNPHDGEDVAQEACLRAIRSAAEFRGSNLKAWLLAIVRNLCFDVIRRRKIIAMDALGDGELADADGGASPVEILQRAEDVAAVRAAIGTLPVELRELVVLREMEAMSYKEIAEVCQLPIGTVMSRLARARGKIAQHLSGAVEKAGK